MGRLKPKCNFKCEECFFHFTDECIAPPGEDYFVKISEKQAKLIFKNQDRFILSPKLTIKLLDKFPTIAN